MVHFDLARSADQKRRGHIRTTLPAHLDSSLEYEHSSGHRRPEILNPFSLAGVVRDQRLQVSQFSGQLLLRRREWLQIAVLPGDEIASLARFGVDGRTEYALHLMHHLPAMGHPIGVCGQGANRLEGPPSIQKNDDRRDEQQGMEEGGFESRLHNTPPHPNGDLLFYSDLFS